MKTPPKLITAGPPISKFISTAITAAPFPRAAIDAPSPPAPAPRTTTSASRSHLISLAVCACAAGATATAAAPIAAPDVRNRRRSIDPLAVLREESRELVPLDDVDICASSPLRPLALLHVRGN